MDVADCLPAELRGATITKIGAGLSGAGVYRVESAGEVFVLKIADEPVEAWRRTLAIQQAAAAAGVAPRVVHADEARRAIVTAFVADRGFAPYFMQPQTRAAALAQLGTTLRRVHELPVPAGAIVSDPRGYVAQVWTQLAGRPLPEFVGEVVRRMLDEPEPPRERALVLCHNDLNPSNVVYDGERLLLLDWQTAGVNDPLYDLAAIAMFMRLDDATCLQLLAAHDGTPVSALPARFGYLRRLIAVLCGTTILGIALARGHAAAGETLDTVPALADFYQQLRAGQVDMASAAGQWRFGLALVKNAAAL
jgi:aminoglycoside phosphotransferase (APT) family kinase protein